MIVGAGAPADLHLVNTCTVTAVADDKSAQGRPPRPARQPRGPCGATGCSVQVGREAFAAVDPAARLVGNEEKDGLLAEIERLLGLPDDGAEQPMARSTRRSRRSPA